MIIFKTADSLSSHLNDRRKQGRKIAFIPTMGALHEGHLSLIDLANQAHDLTICSIFVNPTQFNNVTDYTHYPITIENDIASLVRANCDILFLPHKSEMYGKGYKAKHYDLGYLEDILEGRYRPGHFQGVCQVVDRLLEIVSADTMYLGQKDYQQCMVIKRLLYITNRAGKVELVVGATVREESGLAMSSRNMRLTESQKTAAAAISKALTSVKNDIQHQPPQELINQAWIELEREGFAIDYIEIVSADTLEKATTLNQPLIALIAATTGGVRLIDNMILN